MDPRNIVPERHTMAQVREVADKFRKEYIFNYSIPVEIERVIESTMGIRIIPLKNLQRDDSLEGFISLDFKYIYVDEDLYLNDRTYKRVRFTIAHEIGHLVLHRFTIDMVKFKSEDDWKQFRLNLLSEPLRWFESQASEFAGRLLVPVDQLVETFKSVRTDIIRKNASWDSLKMEDDEVFSAASREIASKFDVSHDVIEIRLKRENVMSLLGS